MTPILPDSSLEAVVAAVAAAREVAEENIRAHQALLEAIAAALAPLGPVMEAEGYPITISVGIFVVRVRLARHRYYAKDYICDVRVEKDDWPVQVEYNDGEQQTVSARDLQSVLAAASRALPPVVYQLKRAEYERSMTIVLPSPESTDAVEGALQAAKHMLEQKQAAKSAVRATLEEIVGELNAHGRAECKVEGKDQLTVMSRVVPALFCSVEIDPVQGWPVMLRQDGREIPCDNLEVLKGCLTRRFLPRALVRVLEAQLEPAAPVTASVE